MNTQQAKQRFGIIGNNAKLINAIDIALQVASTDISVLIIGESGESSEKGITIANNSTASIRFNDDSDAGIIEYIHPSDLMKFSAGGTEGFRIDGSGNAKITGIATVGAALTVGSNLEVNGDILPKTHKGGNIGKSGSFSWNKIYADQFIGQIQTNQENLEVNLLKVSGVSTFVGLSTFKDGIIVESGISTFNDHIEGNGDTNISGISSISAAKVLVGSAIEHSLALPMNPVVQIKGTTDENSSLALYRYGNDGGPPFLTFVKSRNSSIGGIGRVVNGDLIGRIQWNGSDSSDIANTGAEIYARVTGNISGSTSDMPVMQKAADFLDSLEIPFEINALSAHRTPDMVEKFARNAHNDGIKVIIAGAGGAAHLPGVVAAFTTVPVIGVPCRSSISIDGVKQH